MQSSTTLISTFVIVVIIIIVIIIIMVYVWLAVSFCSTFSLWSLDCLCVDLLKSFFGLCFWLKQTTSLVGPTAGTAKLLSPDIYITGLLAAYHSSPPPLQLWVHTVDSCYRSDLFSPIKILTFSFVYSQFGWPRRQLETGVAFIRCCWFCLA